MRWKRFLQFRLATLMLTVALVAVGLSAWLQFVAPNVTGFHIEEGFLVLRLSDELGREMLQDVPNFNAVTSDPEIFVHDAYVSIPLTMVVVAMAMILVFAIGVYFGLRRLVGCPTRQGRDGNRDTDAHWN